VGRFRADRDQPRVWYTTGNAMPDWLVLILICTAGVLWMALQHACELARRRRLVRRPPADATAGQDAVADAPAGPRRTAVELAVSAVATGLGVPATAVRLDDRFVVDYRLPLETLFLDDYDVLVMDAVTRGLREHGVTEWTPTGPLDTVGDLANAIEAALVGHARSATSAPPEPRGA